jgi:hypothetical protein
MIINLSAIRRLHAGEPSGADSGGQENHLVLRRYVLGLSLVAATAVFDERFDLREGCQLKQRPNHEPRWRAVPYVGDDEELPELTAAAALDYAKAAATAFEVGPSSKYEFDRTTAEKWLALNPDDQDNRRRNGPMTKQFSVDANEPVPDSVPEAKGKKRSTRRRKTGGA